MQCCERRSLLRGRVCVVYGALPPEMRRMQARLFNEPGNGYDVLVASDAIGMGLNLNIRRVIFHTLSKTMGGGQEDAIEVPPPQIKQIAGAPPVLCRRNVALAVSLACSLLFTVSALCTIMGCGHHKPPGRVG